MLLPWHLDAEHHKPVVCRRWRVRTLNELCIEALCHRVTRITDDPLRLAGLSDDEHALKARWLSNARRVDGKAVLDSTNHYVSQRRVEDFVILLPFWSGASSLRSRNRLLQLGRWLRPRSQRHFAGEDKDESNC